MPKIDRSTPPEVIREFRHHTGLSQQRLGELIGSADDAISGFERDGAPGWMRYALFGIAVKEIGLRADAAAALVGIAPAGPLLDHVPSSRPPAHPPGPDRPTRRKRDQADEGE